MQKYFEQTILSLLLFRFVLLNCSLSVRAVRWTFSVRLLDGLPVEVRVLEGLGVLFVQWVVGAYHSLGWVSPERASEQKNKRLRRVDFVVDPSTRLLHAD